MGFKRTSEGRVFFQSGSSASEAPARAGGGNGLLAPGIAQDNDPVLTASAPVGAGSATQVQILNLLKSLNERLRVSQSEREYLRGELETYKGLVQDLRQRAETQEKAYKELQGKLDTGEEIVKKSALLERLAKETYKELEETRKLQAELEEKADKTEHELKLQIASIRQSETALKKKQAELENLQVVQQADMAERLDSRQKQIVEIQSRKWNELMDQIAKREKTIEERMLLAEQKVQGYDDRIEEALGRAEKLDRKIEKALQDRMRFIRKLERIEETVIQTHEALNSQAMVLLTDRTLAAQTDYPSRPALPGREERAAVTGAAQAVLSGRAAAAGLWWKRPLPLNAAMAAGVLAAALVLGWATPNLLIPAFSRFEMPEISLSDLALPGVSETAPYESFEPAPQDLAANDTLDFLSEDRAPAAVESLPEPGIEEIERALSGDDADESVIEPDAEEPGLQDPAAQTEETDIDRVLDGFIQNGLEEANDIGAQALTEKEKILQILEESPDQMAAKLNAIEPGAVPSSKPADLKAEPLGTAPQAPAKPEAEKVASASVSAAEKPAAFDHSVRERLEPDRDLPASIKEIERQAFNGSAEAQHDLAAIYTAGHGGVQKNYERAAAWFREASKNGIANASYNLGVLYHQGIGVGQSLDEALSWYKKAADSGHPEAQYNLGIASIEGIGLPYDPQQAAAYFRNAAKAGIMEAAYNLGLIYENGLLGNAKPDEALFWYKTAADKGSPEAKAALEQLARALNIKLEDVNKIVEGMKRESGAG